MKLKTTAMVTRTLGEGEEQFALILRPPTQEEATAEAQAALERMERQLAHVTGWQDVLDEAGNPVPYSPETLKRLMVEDRTLAERVITAVQSVYLESLKG